MAPVSGSTPLRTRDPILPGFADSAPLNRDDLLCALIASAFLVSRQCGSAGGSLRAVPPNAEDLLVDPASPVDCGLNSPLGVFSQSVEVRTCFISQNLKEDIRVILGESRQLHVLLLNILRQEGGVGATIRRATLKNGLRGTQLRCKSHRLFLFLGQGSGSGTGGGGKRGGLHGGNDVGRLSDHLILHQFRLLVGNLEGLHFLGSLFCDLCNFGLRNSLCRGLCLCDCLFNLSGLNSRGRGGGHVLHGGGGGSELRCGISEKPEISQRVPSSADERVGLLEFCGSGEGRRLAQTLSDICKKTVDREDVFEIADRGQASAGTLQTLLKGGLFFICTLSREPTVNLPRGSVKERPD
mmetsp:Transcript_8514/g.16628  ORF Transcript_8514/g.16628 Transcript_8514/m.16628 type:complete len:354 (+) Transcript_8514:755-1816(+)